MFQCKCGAEMFSHSLAPLQQKSGSSTVNFLVLFLHQISLNCRLLIPVSVYADCLSTSRLPPFEILAIGQGCWWAEVPRWPHHHALLWVCCGCTAQMPCLCSTAFVPWLLRGAVAALLPRALMPVGIGLRRRGAGCHLHLPAGPGTATGSHAALTSVPAASTHTMPRARWETWSTGEESLPSISLQSCTPQREGWRDV